MGTPWSGAARAATGQLPVELGGDVHGVRVGLEDREEARPLSVERFDSVEVELGD